MRLTWIFLCLALAGCQAGGAGGTTATDPAAALNPITGDAISTTSLDADLPDPAPAGVVDASQDTGTAAAEPKAAPVEAKAEPEAAAPLPEEVAVPQAAPQVPQAAKSAAQVRCERGGGKYVTVNSNSNLRSCVKITRDAGKSCDREGDCQGQCLARSRTCSPIDPMFGCHEVLQQNGQAVTLCVN